MDEKEELRGRIYSCLDRMGRYHLFLLGALGIFSVIAGYSNTVGVFYTYTPEFYCGKQVLLIKLYGTWWISNSMPIKPTEPPRGSSMEWMLNRSLICKLYFQSWWALQLNCHRVQFDLRESIPRRPLQHNLLCRCDDGRFNLRSPGGFNRTKAHSANNHDWTHPNGTFAALSGLDALNRWIQFYSLCARLL